MKLAKLLFLAMLLCMSCGKDDEPEKEGNCLTASINGEEFIAESTTGTFVTTTIEYENLGTQETKLLTIIGTIPSLTSETRTINLTFACAEFTSDLDLANSDSDCGIGMNYQVTSFTNPNGSTVALATEGGVNVELLTEDRIKGTFTFKGDDQNGTSYNITEGVFDTTIN